MQTTNTVLYTVSGAGVHTRRSVVLSCDEGDQLTTLKLARGIMRAMDAAEKAGAPLPVFQVVRETRESLEGRRGAPLSSVEYQELDLVVFAEKGKPVSDIAALNPQAGFASLALALMLGIAAALALFVPSLFADAIGALASLFDWQAGAMLAAAGALKGRGNVERTNVLTGAALTESGQTQFSREFPVGEGWHALYLRFNNVFTVGTGTTPVAEGELLAIKNVLLRTDRGEIICNLPGRALYKIATYRTGEAPRKDAIAAASATYRVTLPIFFSDFALLRPNDTVLDTKRYNSLSLQVQMGTESDLLGTPGTSSAVWTLDAVIERTMGVLSPEAEPYWHMNYDWRPPIDANVTASIDIERSPEMSIKKLYVHSGTSGTGGVPWSGVNADTIQDVVNIKDQNRFIEKDRIHAEILDVNKMHAGLESVIAGVEVYDFVRDGSIVSALATGDKSVLQYGFTKQGGVGANSIVTLTQEAIRTLK